MSRQLPSRGRPTGTEEVALARRAGTVGGARRSRLLAARRWHREVAATATTEPAAASLQLLPDDPLLSVLLRTGGPVELADLDLDSPGLAALQGQGVVLVVPMISSGELVGLVALGPRRSELGYSADDRALLAGLAGHAAPAIQVAQLVHREQEQAAERERLDHELSLARAIQQQFLPGSPPDLAGWQLAALYRPARSVGGDFYDFVPMPDGQLLVVVGDVTDKGVPAALVMASAHSLLRAHAPKLLDPSVVLATVNDLLVASIPQNMFVTCLVLLLDPGTGEIRLANAGHNLPLVRRADGTVDELRARGMPLGLLPGQHYEIREARLGPGDLLLLHSDGLAEAHDAQRQMYGVPRLAALVGAADDGPGLIAAGLADLAAFAGTDAEQEDDITLVTLERLVPTPDEFDVLAVFGVPSEPDGERAVSQRVRETAAGHGLSERQLDRLATAVAETTMNAMEHGNREDASLDVEVRVLRAPDGVVVEVSDHAVGGLTTSPYETPDLDAKLAGTQAPRGWGLFLVRSMVDEVTEVSSDGRHTVRLAVRAEA